MAAPRIGPKMALVLPFWAKVRVRGSALAALAFGASCGGTELPDVPETDSVPHPPPG